MIDSGAHSWNKIAGVTPPAKTLPPIDEHVKWYEEMVNGCNRPSTMFIELDCFKLFTIAELDEMYARMPRHKTMRVYHPAYDNGSLNTVRDWIADGHTYIGIANDGVHLLDPLFKMTRDTIKVHGFAMTKPDLLRRYPFYSVDSTTPLATAQYGHVVIPSKNLDDTRYLVSKSDAAAKKLLGVTQDRAQRLRAAVIEFKRMEEYFTQLWAVRGITWSDNPWE
ncbi:hypothetical protein KAU11_06280, partial [Candidatus Babeliales bacterium]|nr:hypothetical protein [Candidatus Babeliales bacterium]